MAIATKRRNWMGIHLFALLIASMMAGCMRDETRPPTPDGCHENFVNTGQLAVLDVVLDNQRESYFNGTISISFDGVHSELDLSIPVSVPPRRSTTIYSNTTMQGRGDLSIGVVGGGGESAHHEWSGFVPGCSAERKYAEIREGGIWFSEIKYDPRALQPEYVQATHVGVAACEDPRVRITLIDAALDPLWNVSVKVESLGQGQFALRLNAIRIEYEHESLPKGAAIMGLSVRPEEGRIRLEPGEARTFNVQEHPDQQAEESEEHWTTLMVHYSWLHGRDEDDYFFQCNLEGDDLPDAILLRR